MYSDTLAAVPTNSSNSNSNNNRSSTNINNHYSSRSNKSNRSSSGSNSSSPVKSVLQVHLNPCPPGPTPQAPPFSQGMRTHGFSSQSRTFLRIFTAGSKGVPGGGGERLTGLKK